MSPTCAELEALALFLRDRLELWRIHARGCGVAAPDRVPQWLAEMYRDEVARHQPAKRRAREPSKL